MNNDPGRTLEQLQRRSKSDPQDSEALSLLLIERTRLEGEQAYLEALSNREQWNLYSKGVQDQCIKIVGHNSGEAFQHTETKIYECAGISHRIATFQHIASEALLNLIPGGVFKMGSWLDSGWLCRSSHRMQLATWQSFPNRGFRVAKSLS